MFPSVVLDIRVSNQQKYTNILNEKKQNIFHNPQDSFSNTIRECTAKNKLPCGIRCATNVARVGFFASMRPVYNLYLNFLITTPNNEQNKLTECVEQGYPFHGIFCHNIDSRMAKNPKLGNKNLALHTQLCIIFTLSSV